MLNALVIGHYYGPNVLWNHSHINILTGKLLNSLAGLPARHDQKLHAFIQIVPQDRGIYKTFNFGELWEGLRS